VIQHQVLLKRLGDTPTHCEKALKKWAGPSSPFSPAIWSNASGSAGGVYQIIAAAITRNGRRVACGGGNHRGRVSGVGLVCVNARRLRQGPPARDRKHAP